MVKVNTSGTINKFERVSVESDKFVINRECGEEMEMSRVEEQDRKLKNDAEGALYDEYDGLGNGNGNGGGGW